MSSILKVDQLQDSGGNALITSDGSGTITAGAVTNTPSFFVKADGTQNIAYATATKLEFTNVLYNTNTCFDTSTNRFTPGVAGKYVISGVVGIGAMDDGEYVVAYMYKNGSNFSYFDGQRIRLLTTSPTNTRTINTSISFVDEANATDYYEFYVQQQDTTTNTVNVQYGTWFTAHRLIGA